MSVLLGVEMRCERCLIEFFVLPRSQVLTQCLLDHSGLSFLPICGEQEAREGLDSRLLLATALV